MLNLILLLTAAGALFALYGSHQNVARITAENIIIANEVAAVREENKRLRAEFGFLTVDDPLKIHAVAIPHEQRPLTWAYRVFLPAGRNYFVACRVNDLPLGDEPPDYSDNSPSPRTAGRGEGANTLGIGLTAGEYVIMTTVESVGNGYDFSVQCRPSDVSDATGKRSAKVRRRVVDAEGKWPGQRRPFSEGGVTEQVDLRPGEDPLILLDVRSLANDTGSSESSEGILVWIETDSLTK